MVSLLRVIGSSGKRCTDSWLALQGRLRLFVWLSSRLRNSPPLTRLSFADMAPPFLAYYGAAYAKEDVLLEGYTQCKLYRSALQDGSTKLWKHIPGQDDGLWGTGEFRTTKRPFFWYPIADENGRCCAGNAWAAAGMARVLATILASSSASTMSSQVSDLATWINEILVATFSKITFVNSSRSSSPPANLLSCAQRYRSPTKLLQLRLFHRRSIFCPSSSYILPFGNSWSNSR